MNSARTIHNQSGPPADPAPTPSSAMGTTRLPMLTRRRLHAIGGLVVAVALVASEETRVLVLLIGFAAVVAALAGPWGLVFWRLVQPSLFVKSEMVERPAFPMASPVERRPMPRLEFPDEPMAA